MAESIIAIMESVPGTLSGRGISWKCATTVSGVAYEARSKAGASCELARILVNAGIPDSEMLVFRPDHATWDFRWPSFYKTAKWIYSEGDKTGIHRALYRPLPSAWNGIVGE